MKHNPRQINLVKIKRQIIGLDKTRSAGRVVKNSSFYRIPAVSKYIVGPRIYNPILASLGIKLRQKFKPVYEVNKNNKMNRYMSYTIHKIRDLIKKGEGAKAWRLIKRTMLKSKAFRISAYNQVMRGWYYKEAKSEIWKTMREVDSIIKNEKTNVDIKRVYIPKPNGKLRPLGVPSKPWRIYLHMLNGFLLELLRPSISRNQHGFLPGRGVKTCWQEILNKNFKNVYETDLKNYFNECSSWRMKEILDQVATDLGKYIFEILKSIPDLPENRPANAPDESQYEVKEGFRDPVEDFILSNGIECLEVQMKLSGHTSIEEFLEEQKLIMQMYKKISKNKINMYDTGMDTDIVKPETLKRSRLEWQNYGKTPGGVPQGLPIGPLLAISIGKEYLEQEDSVSYADDQIFFPKERKDIKDNPNLGLIHAPEKCSWIVEEGEWQVERFKFLGFTLSKEYDWESKTRNGTVGKLIRRVKQMFTDRGVELIRKLPNLKEESLNELKNKIDSLETPDNKEILRSISKRRLYGFVMSCMILDDWTNDHAEEDRMKAIENEKLNTNSKSLLLTQGLIKGMDNRLIKKNLQSSLAINYLTHVITQTMRKRRVKA